MNRFARFSGLRRVLLPCGYGLALLFAWPASADEFLMFPNITGAVRNVAAPDHKKKELEPTIDFFYSRTEGSVQVLAEFLLSRDENELERAQLGWTSAQGYTAWLGRFHTPISYWNTAYHHGAYLQPSISRPGIAEYEDHGGIMPMHATGVLVDGGVELAPHRLVYSLSLGQGPTLEHSLEPFNLLSPRGNGKLSFAARVGLQSDESIANEYGFLLGYSDIPIVEEASNQIHQTIAGVYFNRETTRWRFLSEIIFLHTSFDVAQRQGSPTFANGYAHAEYKFNPQWASYGRVEGSYHADNAYLSLFPDFTKSRAMLGARWSPIRNHAVKFEVSHNRRQDGDNYNELAVQWSMVFP